MALTDEQNKLLNDWKLNRDTLASVKESEAQLRARVGMEVFPDAKVGVNTLQLGYGYECKYTKKINYKLCVPPEENHIIDIEEAMFRLCEEMRRTSNEGAYIFERLVKWEPKLSVSEYQKLPYNLRKIVDRYVVTSEGAPTLEIKEPAKKKAF